ncbi:MAG: transposase, partial [Bdellovibrionales bacterium]|nr:transposase [Bdellovibrionales bacterium]
KKYGGILLNTRKGRSTGRPLDTKRTIHLVLRSTMATGDMAFNKSKNKKKVLEILEKFALKYGVKLVYYGINVNHLHLQIQLSNRYGYYKFIRAVTAAIAMAVRGVSRWNKSSSKKKFWDYRPFTRVVMGYKDSVRLNDYLQINQLEGFGVQRPIARQMVAERWKYSRESCSMD